MKLFVLDDKLYEQYCEDGREATIEDVREWCQENGCELISLDDLVTQLTRRLQRERDEAREPEALARLFHETYERLAPHYGYKTREASAVPWEDVPKNNKELMIAVAREVRWKLP